MPRIIPEYAARYPGVTIVLCEGSTVALGKQLSEREIDLYLGKDLRTGPLIRKETLSSDRLFAIATNQLMERQFGQRAAALAERFRKGVYLRELEELPFVTVDPTSKTFQHMDIYCQEHQINFNSVVQVSNTPMLIELCRAGYGAGLCLETFLLQVLQHSADTGQEMLHIFPILDQISGGEIIIAHYEEEEEPRYFSDFKDLVRNTVLSHQF